MHTRRADPYRDVAVIDSRAPRFNQAVIGLVALLAVTTGLWPLLALLALQLWIGLTLGRRWCLPCVAYFEWVQPLIGEGPLEDARPPRFANLMGAVFLTAATVSHLVGIPVLGSALGLTVAGLALLASATGFCAGCQVYRVLALARGVRRRLLERIDLQELGAVPGPGLVVQFTHPLCSDCQAMSRRLSEEGRQVVLVDISRRPDLARKYGIALVPLAYAVAPDGRIAARVRG